MPPVGHSEAHLNADFLPVNAFSRSFLGNKAFAAASIQITPCWRSVNALIEAHLVFPATSGAYECHALYQGLHSAYPYNSALHAHYLACDKDLSCILAITR